jgi:hypothetical protein
MKHYTNKKSTDDYNHTHVHGYAYVCVYACAHVCMRVHVCICVHVCVCAHMHYEINIFHHIKAIKHMYVFSNLQYTFINLYFNHMSQHCQPFSPSITMVKNTNNHVHYMPAQTSSKS